VPVVDQLLSSPTGAAQYSVSATGAIVYVPGGMSSEGTAVPRLLTWVDRQGHEEALKAPTRSYATARLSPDGSRIALSIYDQQLDVWIYDIARQTLQRLSKFVGPDLGPLWSADGRRVFWASVMDASVPNMFAQAADGSGALQRLTTSTNAQFPTSLAPDGKMIVWETISGTFEVRTVSLEDAGKNARAPSAPLIHSPSLNAEVSPDGHWIAYESNESGHFEVYVRPYPRVDDGQVLISTAGGTRAAWSRNGKELFYVDGDGFLTGVSVQTAGASFKAGPPTKIASTPFYAGTTTRGQALRGYDVSADGQRFLLIKEAEASARQGASTAAQNLVVVVNWIEELKARMGN
jgi:serine/threonine-protein kinase